MLGFANHSSRLGLTLECLVWEILEDTSGLACLLELRFRLLQFIGNLIVQTLILR